MPGIGGDPAPTVNWPPGSVLRQGPKSLATELRCSEGPDAVLRQLLRHRMWHRRTSELGPRSASAKSLSGGGEGAPTRRSRVRAGSAPVVLPRSYAISRLRTPYGACSWVWAPRHLPALCRGASFEPRRARRVPASLLARARVRRAHRRIRGRQLRAGARRVGPAAGSPKRRERLTRTAFDLRALGGRAFTTATRAAWGSASQSAGSGLRCTPKNPSRRERAHETAHQKP